MKTFIYLLPVLLLANRPAIAQHQGTATGPTKEDSASTLYEAFQKGKASGHVRYFFMATDNRDQLSDYYANALGGGLKFETAPFRKLQLGISGFFIYNIGSSDLSKQDEQTHQQNRYELSLFDLQDPHNRNDIDRLEELYLRYKSSKAELTFGKQLVTTPFINPQDSRMRPTEVEGFYATIHPTKKLELEGGWLYSISPRSTVRWFSVARSIGVYSQGLNTVGSQGDYEGNLQSGGVALLGATYHPIPALQLKVHNLFIGNISNTVLLQAGYEKAAGKLKVKTAVQYIRQDAVNKGGNPDRAKTYFDPANKVHIGGVRAGVEKGRWEADLNYTRIGKSGRFTMPREWGTEPLFTYLSRERNEGLGDVQALMARVKGSFPKQHLKTELAYGHWYLPDVNNAALNKYGLPAYRHLKAMADYEFGKALKGLDIAFLFVYKAPLNNRDYEPKFILNKVDMASFNLVMNYHFHN